jgi:hypothetical protein
VTYWGLRIARHSAVAFTRSHMLSMSGDNTELISLSPRPFIYKSAEQWKRKIEVHESSHCIH